MPLLLLLSFFFFFLVRLENKCHCFIYYDVSPSVESDSVTPWTSACQGSLSSTISQSFLKFMSIECIIYCTFIYLFKHCEPSNEHLFHSICVPGTLIPITTPPQEIDIMVFLKVRTLRLQIGEKIFPTMGVKFGK